MVSKKSNKLPVLAKENRIKDRKSTIHIMRRLLKAFRPYTLQVSLVGLILVISTLLGVVNPILIREIFDHAIPHGDITYLLILTVVMIITPLLSGLIGVVQSYLSNIIGQRVMRDLRSQLYEHLQNMPLSFFTSTRTGEIQSRLANDASGAQSVITDTAATAVTNLTAALSLIIAMVYISPLLTIISLGLLPLFLWITYRVGNVRRLTTGATQQSLSALTAFMQETLSVSGILLIKTFGRQQYARQQFEKENQQLMELGIRQYLIGRWFMMFVNAVFAIAPAIIYLVAGLQVITGKHASGITLGGIIAFTTLQARLFTPLGQLLLMQINMQGSLALFERIFEYLDMPLKITSSHGAIKLSSENVQGQIAFKDVCFTYHPDENALSIKKWDIIDKKRKSNGKIPPPSPLATEAAVSSVQQSSQPVLKNISFVAQPGQLVALVGPSGAGKTTITYLLARLYDVDGGSIEIDNHDIRDITLSSLSELIGMVSQEIYMFHSSIRANLLYACPDATEETIVNAAKAAAIHERILQLEHGYDTIVGERGYKLSGGEKQRLAIARVLIKNPRILILDEATSSLDTHSERLIQSALEPLMQNRTTIAIAHRLSTILSADLILVIDNGRIVEQGTHQGLLAQGGLYSRLYQEQFLQPISS